MTKIPVMEFADHDGNLDANKLVEALITSKVTLYGMDMQAIRMLKHDYFARGGNLPITKETVAALSVRPEAALTPEGCTPADAMVLREGNAILAEENHNLRRCLRWYAAGNHYTGLKNWEGPSGDDNWLCPPLDDDDRAEFFAALDESLVEDGTIAAVTVRTGKFEVESPEDEPPLVKGEPEWHIEQQAKEADKPGPQSGGKPEEKS